MFSPPPFSGPPRSSNPGFRNIPKTYAPSRISRTVLLHCSQPLSQMAWKSERTSSRELQQLGQLPRDAEPVVLSLEGEFDHVVPVHRPWKAKSRCCKPSAVPPHSKTLLKSFHTACLESRVCGSVHEAYVQSLHHPPRRAKCDPHWVCYGGRGALPQERAGQRHLLSARLQFSGFNRVLSERALGGGSHLHGPLPRAGSAAAGNEADDLERFQALRRRHSARAALSGPGWKMEDVWSENKHIAKLSVNALIAL